MSKKGGLQLGINTIVVLVIAMVLIGAGISLITGLVGQGEDELGKAISIGQIEKPPSRTQPITIDKEDLSVKKGATEKIKVVVGVYNTHTTDQTVDLTFSSCKHETDAAAKPLKTFSSGETLKAGEGKGYEMFIYGVHNDGTEATVGTYICTLQAATEIPTKQLVIELYS